MDYLGTPVFLEQPNRQLSVQEPQQLEAVVMDARTGVRTVEPRSPVPTKSRQMEMLAMDLGEAYVLRAFLHARVGRQKAFWSPTWQRDLVLAAAALSGAGDIVVRECGYATRLWPSSPARRHLLLLPPAGGAPLTRRVFAAVSNGDGTETLTLIGPAGETTHGVAIATTWLVCFLLLRRLDDDQVLFRWRGGAAVVPLPFRELPAEVPA